jgi:hypothetical protein
MGISENDYCLRYKIEELENEGVYLVSTNVSICLESNGPCELDLKILENVKLPKSLCDFSQGFAIPGKSF